LPKKELKRLLPQRLKKFSNSREFGESAKSKLQKQYITDVDVRFALDQVFKLKSVSEDKIKDLMRGDGVLTRSRKNDIEEDASLIVNISWSEQSIRDESTVSIHSNDLFEDIFEEDISDPLGLHKSFFVAESPHETSKMKTMRM